MSSLFALFLVTSLANILTPGLGVVMIITLAAEYGWRRTMSGALGTALGIAFLFIAGMSGVGVIVASSPMLFAAIYVDKRGNRIVNEGERRDVIRDAVLGTPERYGYTVCDNTNFMSYDALKLHCLKTEDSL